MQRLGKFLPLMVIAVVMAGLGFGSCKTDETDDSGTPPPDRKVMGVQVKSYPNINLLETYQGLVPPPSASAVYTFLDGLEVDVTYSDKTLHFVISTSTPNDYSNFTQQLDENGTSYGTGIISWNNRQTQTIQVDISVKTSDTNTVNTIVPISVKPITSFRIVAPPVSPSWTQGLTGWYRLGTPVDNPSPDYGIKTWFKNMIAAGGQIVAYYGNVKKIFVETVDPMNSEQVAFSNITDADLTFDGYDMNVVGKQTISVKLFDDKTSSTNIEAVVLPLLLNKAPIGEYTEMQDVYNGQIRGARAGSTGAFGTSLFSEVTTNGSYYIKSFKMGKYEIPYALWYGVGQWAAKKKGYSFYGLNSFNIGKEGSDGSIGAEPTSDLTNGYQPAMQMTWLGAAVWCNAYTELIEEIRTSWSVPTGELRTALDLPTNQLKCVYLKYSSRSNTSNPDPLREITITGTAGTTFDIVHSNNGFRLPDEAEWEWAARGSQEGTDPWNFTYAGSNIAKEVAWCKSIVDGEGVNKTHGIGGKDPVGGINLLQLFDMTGNVWEWCIKLHPRLALPNDSGNWGTSYTTPSALASSGLNGQEIHGVAKGGSFMYLDGNEMLRLDTSRQAGLQLIEQHGNTGFRIVRSNK